MELVTSRIVATLAPAPGNPRNSEGSFLALPDGRLAFAYSRYIGDDPHDHGACEIAVIYSPDGGEHWTETPEQLVSAAEYGEANVMSVSLIDLGDGETGLGYLLKRPGLRSEYYLRRYMGDLAHPIGEARVLPDRQPGYYVVNNDRIVRLPSGRLLVPAALHPSAVMADPDSRDAAWADGRGEICCFASDDNGQTWRRLWSTLSLSVPHSRTGLQEPGLLPLGGDIVYGYYRTDLGRQYESVSLDGGERWFTPQPSAFTSPASPMLIKQNPHDGRFYALWNPVPEYQTRPKAAVWTGGRDPLVMAASEDGLRFGPPTVIESDPTRGFCYPALHFLDGTTALLAYCSGGTEDGGCLRRTTIRKLTWTI